MTAFVTIDFETVNGNLASIRQIGVAMYSDGQELDTFSTLVNPEEPFWLTTDDLIDHPDLC